MTRRWNGRAAWLLMLAAFAVVVLTDSAFAQGTIRGVVRDAAGQPVADAVVTIESQQQSRTLQAKTNARGEYLQIGLPYGQYRVTVTKDKMGAEPAMVTLRAGRTMVADFTIAPPGTAAAAVDPEAAKARIAELQRVFEEGVAASKSQQYDAAIEKFKQAIEINPNCFDCYNNIGYIYTQRKQFDQAEAAYKQSTIVKPDDPAAYNGLAAVYNALRRFDEAAAASAKANELSGAGAVGGGGDANALYNQGVILWNGGKIAEAKNAFQSAVAADPNHAEAHYQLGMALVNEGNTAGAASAFETYLKLAPSGPNAPTAKALLSQLKP